MRMVEWDILCMISDSVFLGIPFFLHGSSMLSCLNFRVDRMSRYRLSHKSLSSSSLSTSYHDSKDPTIKDINAYLIPATIYTYSLLSLLVDKIRQAEMREPTAPIYKHAPTASTLVLHLIENRMDTPFFSSLPSHYSFLFHQ